MRTDKESLTELVIRAKSGEVKAVEELLIQAHAPISYQCCKYMSNPQDIEDQTQEILIQIYTKLEKLHEPAAFWGWANRITANHCLNFVNRHHQDLQLAEDEDGHSILDDLEDMDEQKIPDKALDNAETTRMIDQIVSALPDAQRITTMMFYFDEMSVKEIAEAMGIPEGTVKSRLNHARKAIKEEVEACEKQGVKLYSVSILPFLWYFLRKSANDSASKTAASACVSNVLAAATTGAAVTGAVASGTAVVTGKVLTGIVAGITATALVIGGGIGLIAGKLTDRASETSSAVPSTSIVMETASATEPALFEPQSAEDAYRLFMEAKAFYDKELYGTNQATDSEFRSLDYFDDWRVDVIERGGYFYQANGYAYADFVEQLHQFFSADVVESLIEVCGIIDHNGDCYVNLKEGLGDVCLGDYSTEILMKDDGSCRILISYLDIGMESVTESMNTLYENGRWVLDGVNFYRDFLAAWQASQVLETESPTEEPFIIDPSVSEEARENLEFIAQYHRADYKTNHPSATAVEYGGYVIYADCWYDTKYDGSTGHSDTYTGRIMIRNKETGEEWELLPVTTQQLIVANDCLFFIDEEFCQLCMLQLIPAIENGYRSVHVVDDQIMTNNAHFGLERVCFDMWYRDGHIVYIKHDEENQYVMKYDVETYQDMWNPGKPIVVAKTALNYLNAFRIAYGCAYYDYYHQYDEAGNIIGPAEFEQQAISCIFENDEYVIFRLAQEDETDTTMIYNKMTGEALKYDGSYALGAVVDGRSYAVFEVGNEDESGYIDCSINSSVTDLGI